MIGSRRNRTDSVRSSGKAARNGLGDDAVGGGLVNTFEEGKDFGVGRVGLRE